MLYGKFDKYWEVQGKYSYSEFKQTNDTNNVTVWVNTASLSPYPEHITYNTIDAYKTDVESGRENEIIVKLSTALKDGLGASENFIPSIDEITSNKLGELKTAIENNKEKEMKIAVVKLCNVFDFNIIGLYNKILDEQSENIKSINDFCETTLKCEGTARWDWRECKTTFNITSLKFTVGESENNLIKPGESIDIKKEYVENSTNNDIQESDILVNLLQNNKLFYEHTNDDNSSTEYVFNLSKIIYYVYPSMYYKREQHYNTVFCYCLKCKLNNTVRHTSYITFNLEVDISLTNKRNGDETIWFTCCNHNKCYEEIPYLQKQFDILNARNIQNRRNDAYNNGVVSVLCDLN